MIDHLLNRTATVRRATGVTFDVRCALQQTRRGEEDGHGPFSVTEWRLFLPAEGHKELVQSMAPALYWPLDAENGATDLSGNGRDGTGAGGITVGGDSSDPLERGGTSTAFDGTDDRVVSGYGTRRNLWTNPRGLAAVGLGGLNVQGSQAGATADQVVFADHDIPDLTLPGGSEIKTGFHVVTVGVNQGIRLPSASVVNGAAYTVSAYVYVVSGAVDAQIVLVGNGPDVVAGSGWQRVAHTSTITADTADFTVRSTSGAAEFYVTLALVEQASEALPPFDGDGYVDEQGRWHSDNGGRVGWTGTPHASPSDMGVFANGTTRTFAGWAYRDTMDSEDVLWGGTVDEVAHPLLSLGANNDNVSFGADQSAETDSWSDAWVGIGKWAHWALVFDEAADTAELFIDGESKGIVTHEAQWPATPGNFQIAARRAGSGAFDGKMGHVAVFERGLTPGEIATLADPTLTTADEVEIDGETFQVFGQPWVVHNEATGIAHHIEATLKVTGSDTDLGNTDEENFG